MRAFLLTLGFTVAGACEAQLLDSIALFSREPGRFVARLDVRGSFISNSPVRIAGVKAGIEHGRRFQYGLGYSFLFTPVERDGDAGGVVRLRMGYVSPYVDYAFFQRGPWEARIPVQLGFGSGALALRRADGERRILARSGLIIYEPAMTIQYRFLRYFGIGAGWGFRWVIQTGDDLGERLTAPIYLFGLRVFIGDLWRDARPKGD